MRAKKARIAHGASARAVRAAPSSVSDFVLHAAKQNGSAILEGIIQCWYFPVFPSALSAV
jgi:hypothetical protein